jgi:hypothetical protein
MLPIIPPTTVVTTIIIKLSFVDAGCAPVLRMFDPEEITPATMTIPAIYFPAANET